MPRGDVIRVEGEITAVVGTTPKLLVRVQLDNGHRLLAYSGRRDASWAAGVRTGRRVTVEVSPFDFSTGRLVPG